jgi:hypothetical protein
MVMAIDPSAFAACRERRLHVNDDVTFVVPRRRDQRMPGRIISIWYGVEEMATVVTSTGERLELGVELDDVRRMDEEDG